MVEREISVLSPSLHCLCKGFSFSSTAVTLKQQKKKGEEKNFPQIFNIKTLSRETIDLRAKTLRWQEEIERREGKSIIRLSNRACS